jgi:hypothetical protein
MAKETRDFWLKIILGILFTIIVTVGSMGAKGLDKKVDKETFNKHEVYQDQQFKDMKEYQKERFESFEKLLKASRE